MENVPNKAMPKIPVTENSLHVVEAMVVSCFIDRNNNLRWVPTILPHHPPQGPTKECVEQSSVGAKCIHGLKLGRDPYSYDEKELDAFGKETGDVHHFDVSWVCDRCSVEANREVVYSCQPCNFDLCVPCALSQRTDAPLIDKFDRSLQDNIVIVTGMPTHRGNTLIPWDNKDGNFLAHAPHKPNDRFPITPYSPT
jgi:hypothetical protein